MLVKLTKVESTHDRLRTNEVEGNCPGLPRVGERFHLISAPLNPSFDLRMVRTSPVKEIAQIEGGRYEMKTENSTYRLQILEN